VLVLLLVWRVPRSTAMDRFAEALTSLSISDSRSKEAIAPHLKRFLEAAQDLQRALAPQNGSVHAAVSRATPMEDEQATGIEWVLVFDRVGLFDVEDRNVARLVDAALRYVWRKEEADALISSVGQAGDRIVIETRRALRGNETGGGRVENTEPSVEGPTREMMTMPGLRARVAFSPVRPPVCVPSASGIAAVKAVLDVVAASSNPARLCRDMGLRAFIAYQSFVIADAGLTAETLVGSHAIGDSSDPSAVAASSTSALSGSPAQASEGEGSGGGAAGSGSGSATSTAAAAVAVDSPMAGTVADAVKRTASADAAALSDAAALTVAAALTDAAASADASSSADAVATAVRSAVSAASGGGSVGREGAVDVPLTPGSNPPLSAGVSGEGDGGGAGDAAGGDGDGVEELNNDATDKTGAADLTNASSAAAPSAATSDGAPPAGSAAVAAGTPETQRNGQRRNKVLVLGYLVAYARTKWLPTWSFPEKGKKGPAVPGTIANPRGSVTVDKHRSMWCARVSMEAIKPSFLVPGLAGRRLKLSQVPDELLFVELTDFKCMKMSEVVASLLLLCTHEPEAVRIVKEIAAGSFEARPSRHPSLVLSGLELEKVADDAGGRAGGAGGAAAVVGSTNVGEAGNGDNGG